MEATVKTIRLNLDRKAGRFVLDIDGTLVRQNVCEFLHTLSFLVAQDVETYLLSTDSRYDNVRIPLTSAGASASLSLHEFLALRDVYGEQMFLLKLEDLLLKKGISSRAL
jgi:hypothetical protein